MKLRLALFGCAAAAAAIASPVSADAPARCDTTNLRVYFSPGATTLDDTALEALNVAQANMAECTYAELRVRLDPATPDAQARGQAVLAATGGRWNVRALEALSGATSEPAPDYAEVVMSPTRLPAGTPLRGSANTGV